MGQVNALWKLQEIEIKLAEEKNILKNVSNSKEINEKIMEHKGLMKKYESENATVEDIKKEIRRLEQLRNDIGYKGEEVKGKLYGGKISDLKQLGVLLREQEKIEGEMNDVDVKIIELMENIELKEDVIKKLNEEEKKMGGTIRKMLRERKEQKTEGEKIIQELLRDREETLKEISSKNLSLYTTIKSKRKNPVAVIRGDICMGCHMDVSIMTITQLRVEEIVTCSNCGRILYIMDQG